MKTITLAVALAFTPSFLAAGCVAFDAKNMAFVILSKPCSALPSVVSDTSTFTVQVSTGFAAIWQRRAFFTVGLSSTPAVVKP